MWHRIFGVVTFFYFGTHLVWLAGKTLRLQSRGYSWTKILFGPDSPVPTLRDFKDLFRMMRWFFGLGPKPGFERWSYWEKFDYWAVFWGVGIIGTSGLMLWFPNLFCTLLPGRWLNVAKVIHSEEALLATGFVFAVHFFHSLLRPEKFPLDLSMLTGLVSVEEMQHERPEYYQRMREEGRLREMRAVAPSRIGTAIIFTFGAIAFFIGVALLVGIFVGVLGG
jgi:cytochrome b subunit of formate dehydrogenase